ncbi:hypothetical protein [Kitasatospora mediocidica]|uniref:hypothetical protein n=1 Tax=Kitasatospora mediocidica TaxID=58352 RepID=UPI00056856AE|nr:hypothetical protein [Kitasatospora mediocidica]
MTDKPVLSAKPDPLWMRVILHADEVRNDSFRELARAWRDNPDLAVEQLDRLAAAVDRPIAWAAAVADMECDLQMGHAQIGIDEEQARGLADELVAAAQLTSSARMRAERLVVLPHQDRRRAA